MILKKYISSPVTINWWPEERQSYQTCKEQSQPRQQSSANQSRGKPICFNRSSLTDTDANMRNTYTDTDYWAILIPII